MKFRIISCLYLSFFFSCGPSIPSWVNTQPTNDQFWHGIGQANKILEKDARSKAKEFAIHEISSQIKVNISSEMEITIREANESLENMTSMFMKSRTNLLIPEIEFVESYESKESFYFYARLNKQKYYETLKRLRQNAAKTALDYIVEADKSFNANSFLLIQKAWQQILPFADEPLTVTYENRPAQIYSLIHLKHHQFTERIALVSTLKQKQMKTLIDRDNTLMVTVMDSKINERLEGIPVKIRERNQEFNFISGSEGTILYPISPIPTIGGHTVEFSFNESQLYEGLPAEGELLDITPSWNSIQIHVIPARVALHTTELNLGRPLTEPILKPMIKQAFSGEIEFVESNADIIMTIQANTKNKSRRTSANHPFFSYGSAEISLMDAAGREVFFTHSLSDVKGGDFDSQSVAGIRAYEKMGKMVLSELKFALHNR